MEESHFATSLASINKPNIMNNLRTISSALMGHACILLVAQTGNWTTTGNVGWLKTNPSTKGVQIGNAPASGFGSLLTINSAFGTATTGTTHSFYTGGPALSNVFETNVAASTASLWQVKRAGVQRGYLSLESGFDHFNLGATTAQLRLMTNAGIGLRLMPDQSATVGEFTFPVNGYVGIGAGADFIPWARLHVHDGTSQPAAPFRDWMKSGLLTTSNESMLYIGLKSGVSGAVCDFGTESWPGNHRAVVQWGGGSLCETLSFVMTSEASGIGAPSAGSADGQLVARMDRRGLRIGPFPVNPPAFPTLRKHSLLVHGYTALLTMRDYNQENVQNLKLLSANDTGVVGYRKPISLPTATKVLVMSSGGANEKIGYRELSTMFPPPPPTEDYDWKHQPSGDLVTAWPNPDGFPDEEENVGIGLGDPTAKLHLRSTFDSGFGPAQVTTLSENPLSSDNNIAMQAYCSPPSPSPTSTEYGLHSLAQDGYTNYGVHSTGRSNSAMGDLNVGVFGRANCTHPGQKAFGIWGVGQADAPCAAYAAWFDGNVLYTGENVHVADLNVKTNIVPLSGASNLIAQLLPKRFNFNTGAFPNLRLPAGPHMGLLAQDVEAVIPGLVKDVERPGVYSSNGTLMEAPVTTKTVNYTELITLLIAAFKEQEARFNTVTASLQSQITALSNTVNSCCQGGGNFRSVEQVENGGGLLAVPNPFSGATVLHYGLEAESEVRVVVLDGAGQLVQEIFAGTLPAGEHQAEWRAGDVAAGLYHVTLWVNDKAEIGTVLKVSE